MRKAVIAALVLAVMLMAPRVNKIDAAPLEIHTCRHPDNGVETTHTVSLFVACVPKAQQCSQAAQSFKAPKDVRVIKGFPDPFLRPWDASGNPNRCDPKGNTDVPCWAASELVVYKRAPNKKCLCDSD
jgi:hypothetical protein